MKSPADTRAFSTDNVHSDRRFGVEHGGIHKPIHTSVQYGFDRVEDLIGAFQGTYKGGYQYARQGTPTTAALEAKITALENGAGTICFSTGMGAIAATLLTLLRAGDHLVASRFIFGNTNSLLGTIEGLGIAVDKVDACSVEAVAAAIRPETRMVFVETIANPRTQVADLAAIGELCRERGLLYVVDNTITSPALFRPRVVGASLVINSLTKTIAGHGEALGGAVTDTGLFDWTPYPNIFASYRKGDPKAWGLQQIRKKGLRDMGATLSSDQAHRISIGSETLPLRVKQSSNTALALAQWLERHPKVDAVHYPFLPSHAQHERAKDLFAAGSWLLSFELRDPSSMVDVLNRLALPIKATGLGDTRTLIIPVAPTIFWEAGPVARAAMGIAEGLIRVSVGLEDEADLIADFERALQ
ncbi:MAG TPA: cystathionine gamma-synthase family protein [Aromatoleum sp.]|uniref:cystathionine gamma-synthase family protein n=1 Tax=Aromatoleum sp. TaxID=2307007 RepID=UPI002B49DDF5|nr:cystathionine gamma-synthase family protein [Aromatoleum sp.]HJV25989.1 cystathionine gamma-synthase family protein [Aromatoleum sp.]